MIRQHGPRDKTYTDHVIMQHKPRDHAAQATWSCSTDHVIVRSMIYCSSWLLASWTAISIRRIMMNSNNHKLFLSCTVNSPHAVVIAFYAVNYCDMRHFIKIVVIFVYVVTITSLSFDFGMWTTGYLAVREHVSGVCTRAYSFLPCTDTLQVHTCTRTWLFGSCARTW